MKMIKKSIKKDTNKIKKNSIIWNIKKTQMFPKLHKKIIQNSSTWQ